MYAVIDSGGKQYRLNEGDVIQVEKLKGDVGDEVKFDDVLLLSDDDETVIGSPVIQEAQVVGTIVEQKKGDKIIVFKFKRRKMYRKKKGHRQLLTAVQINSIVAKGKQAPAKAAEATKPSAKKDSAEAAPKEAKKATSKKSAPAAKKPATETKAKKAKAEDKQEE